MTLIDTHAHLYLDDFQDDIDEVIRRAREMGVHRVCLPNIDETTIEACHMLGQKQPEMFYPMVGLHPGSVDGDWKEKLTKLMAYREGCEQDFVAIGEIGMDAYWDTTWLAEQEQAFRAQVEWAIAIDLPIVIHSRETTDKIIDILSEPQLTSARGVFHCFTGEEDQARRIIERGFYLGIGGVLTYKKSNLSEALKNVDLDYMVLETDAPYLSPVPKRGKRNESSYIRYTAERLAECLEIPLEIVMKYTTSNAQKLFNIH